MPHQWPTPRAVMGAGSSHLRRAARSHEVTPGTSLWLQCLHLPSSPWISSSPFSQPRAAPGTRKAFFSRTGRVRGRSGGSQVTSPLRLRTWHQGRGADTKCHFQSTGKCWCWFEVVRAAGKYVLCLF